MLVNQISKDTYLHKGPSGKHKLRRLPESVPSVSGRSAIVSNSEINVKKPAEINFCGFFSAEKMAKFYKESKGLKKIIEFASDQQLVFSAGFALILTAIFRPAAIMALPGKKNKDDKKYAAGHSIASGIIGLAISTILFTPVSNAIKKLKEAPTDFIKNKNSYLLKNEKALATMRKYLDRFPELITAIPKGILTVALIPIILKYVFGMEKKHKKGSPQVESFPINYALLNFKSAKKKEPKAFASFKGGLQK